MKIIKIGSVHSTLNDRLLKVEDEIKRIKTIKECDNYFYNQNLGAFEQELNEVTGIVCKSMHSYITSHQSPSGNKRYTLTVKVTTVESVLKEDIEVINALIERYFPDLPKFGVDTTYLCRVRGTGFYFNLYESY